MRAGHRHCDLRHASNQGEQALSDGLVISLQRPEMKALDGDLIAEIVQRVMKGLYVGRTRHRNGQGLILTGGGLIALLVIVLSGESLAATGSLFTMFFAAAGIVIGLIACGVSLILKLMDRDKRA